MLKAGGVGENGNLYLLDMGESVRIRDLAEQMIRFHGLEPIDDIGIEYVGLRPGERLDEKLLWDFEIPHSTNFDRILKVDRNEPGRLNINAIMEELRPVCRFDPAQAEKYRNNNLLKKTLREYIPSYASEATIPADVSKTTASALNPVFS